MAINWQGMQAAGVKNKAKKFVAPAILPRYMTMASFHADLRKDGESRKKFKASGEKGPR